MAKEANALKSRVASTVELRPRYGALCAFTVTLLGYTPTVAFFEDAPQFYPLADTFLFCFMLAAALSALIGLLRALAPSGGGASRFRTPAAVGTYLVATLLFAALLMAPEPLPAGAALAGVVAGAAFPEVVSAWACAVACPMGSALLVCASVGCVASFGGWLLALLPLHLLVPLFCVLLVAGSVPLLLIGDGQGGNAASVKEVTADDGAVAAVAGVSTVDGVPAADADPVSSGRSSSSADDTSGTPEVPGPLRRLASVTWLPLAGLAMYAFMTDVANHSAFGVVQTAYLGGFLAAAVVLIACACWARRPLLPWCYRVLVPALGAAFVVLGAFPAGTFPQEASTVALYLFYIVLAMLGCALFLAVVHGREVPARVACSFAVAVVAGAGLVGQILSAVLVVTDDFSSWISVLTGLFVAALLVFLGHTAWVGLVTPRDDALEGSEEDVLVPTRAFAPSAASPAIAPVSATEPSMRVTLEARCAEVAAAHGLSPREGEVLVYLARGFTPAYIAKSLVLSISTVRTHVRNIYRKLGIGKREELLHLIDGE
ncbi:helix-turn-helix transcriptional regulator [Adlercreutzia sp. R21]|uniref:helix-turn-helix transcriptional regulator n=1 Tax=Adlercreutzia wanghongyangiae TaxID=3111451 RepID=UPI002DB67F65|nr:helix-turn-helix transcriptional regulator [Adlercreutzia sp. R21]MEC4184746.1 helix-turn-helix transcriptional regulator [Adlercreutzia sp. R21]